MGIQFCIAMDDFSFDKFNNIIKEIMKKSLFTQRQIEIILNFKNIEQIDLGISKGAYYRQVSQSREKLSSLYYSIVLLRVLGILLPDDIDVLSKLSQQASVLKDGDVFAEREEDIMSVINQVISKTTAM